MQRIDGLGEVAQGDEAVSTFMILSGKVRVYLEEGEKVVELAELDSMRKREASDIKTFITAKVDKYRPAYGQYAVEVPRRRPWWPSTTFCSKRKLTT